MTTKYVSLEEVMKILKNWEWITYDCDTIEDSFDMLADIVEIIPTLEIDTLQRYDTWDYSTMKEYDDWGYIKYSDLIDLLRS